MKAYLILLSLVSIAICETSFTQEICDNKPFGYKFLDETDCHGYFLCHGNVTLQQYCAYGMKFVAEVQSCVVGKCPPCDCTTTSTETTWTPTTPDPLRPDCSKYENGTRLPNIQHCRLFWQCVSGTALSLFCELGMWYDRERYVCNFPHAVTNCPAMQD